jgi:very-short-patch-repair endonuclease
LRKPTVYAARKLRRQMSPPEVLLWDQLRASKMGFKVRRQHPIGPYVADFFVSGAGLAIEIDGMAHDVGERPARDIARDKYMNDRRLRVLRVAAADVMKNLEGVLALIVEQAKNPLHHPSDGPPPHSGEEF